MEHELVPKHAVMGPEEAEEILKTYKVSSEELPKIKNDDPAIKELDAKVGDIIKIIRKSSTAGTSNYYRVVI